MLAKLEVGKRMALGFGLIILLSLVASATSMWQFVAMARQADEMSRDSMAKERLISDLNLVINAAVRRTMAISKSSDPSLAKFFESDAKETASRATEIMKKLDKFELSAPERSVYEKMREKRELYTAAKNEAVKAQAAGDAKVAGEIFDGKFVPLSKEYLAAVDEMAGMQRSRIDEQARKIQQMHSEGEAVLAVATLAVALAGVACSMLLTRGLLAQLGGEPGYAALLAKSIAQGKLDNQVKVRAGDHSSLVASMAKMQSDLARMVGEVREGAKIIASAAEEIASGNADLSARTETQASAVEGASASMARLTETVRQNLGGAGEARALAASASDVAAKGGMAVSEVVATMGAISQASARVVDIIGVIDSIAFQTNILALNAAVEAARAGEQGRGFAVVATEVRALAGRSSEAARQIKSLIAQSAEAVERGGLQVAKAGQTMDGVVGGVEKVAAIMGDIERASREQAEGIEKADREISQMDKSTHQNAALVEQAAAASQTLRDQSQHLMRAIESFQLG